MKYALTQSSTSSLPFPNTTDQKKCVLLQVETAQSDSKEAGTFMTRRELLAHGGTSYSPPVSSMPLGRAWRPKLSRLRSMLRPLFPGAFGHIHRSSSVFSVRLIWRPLHYATASFMDPGRGLLQVETLPTRCAIGNLQSQVSARVSGHGCTSKMLEQQP